MTYHNVSSGLAGLFRLGLENQMPEKIKEWQGHLDAGRLTDEMRGTFTALGWLTPRDSRLQRAEDEAPADEPEQPRQPRRRREPDIDVAESAEPEEVTIREPAGVGG